MNTLKDVIDRKLKWLNNFPRGLTEQQKYNRRREIKMANIHCAEPGCINNVIGQCIGYPGDCGRFHCAVHTADNLCSICLTRKKDDKAAEKLYQEYTREARKIKSAAHRAFYPYQAILGVIYLYIFFSYLGDQSNTTTRNVFISSIVLLFVIVWYLGNKRSQKEKKMVLDKTGERPGFERFYGVGTS